MGSFNTFKYKSTNIEVFGINYENLSFKDMRKLLLLSNADFILVPIKPDEFLNNFNINVFNPKTNKLS